MGTDDSSRIVRRGFDSLEIKRFRSDPDFNYSEVPRESETLWSRFRRGLTEWFNKMFRAMVGTDWGNILAYGLGALALIFIILRLLDIDAFGWLAPLRNSDSLTATVIEENIYEMNFDDLLGKAVSQEDYRQAIRLLFLHALRLLSDRNQVFWKPGKTNLDYLGELTNDRLKPGFRRLGYYFDHAWYGRFPVGRQSFLTARETFEEWKRSLTA